MVPQALLNVFMIRTFKVTTACIFSILVVFVLGITKQYATVFLFNSDSHMLKKSTHNGHDYEGDLQQYHASADPLQHQHAGADLQQSYTGAPRHNQLLNQSTRLPAAPNGWKGHFAHDESAEETNANWRGLSSELYGMAPEVFDNVPTSFDSAYKSPCWKTHQTLYCLPYFYIAGMPKCGTSDIWDKLVQHPSVMRMRKEPHWWSRGRIGKGTPILNQPPGTVPFSVYATRHKHYKKFYRNIVQESPKEDATVVLGDGSASTFWDCKDWKSKEPPYVVADIINTVQPRAKVIVIFRDPISRLYSDYLYFHDDNTKRSSFFHKLAQLSIDSWNECRAEHSLRHCVYSVSYMDVGEKKAAEVFANRSLDFTPPPLRLHLGMYSVFLRDWLKSKRLEDIYVLHLDEWHDNCETLLPAMFQFLKLKPLSRYRIRKACGTDTKNVNERKKKVDMYNDTRTLLYEFYRPFNEDLASILQDTKFLFK